jgi:hypothetical protein
MYRQVFRMFPLCSAYSMTRLLRWISRRLGVIQISLIISHPEDAKMVRLDLEFCIERSSTITYHGQGLGR